MTIYELHLAFNDTLDNISSSSYPNISHEQRDRFLNLGAERFIKQRYGGSNPKTTGFEETQKRMDDLSNLVRYSDLQPFREGFFRNNYAKSIYYQLPVDYWFALSEQVDLIDPICGTLTVGVKAERHNNINTLLEDPFNRPKNIRTWRVLSSGLNEQAVSNLIQLFYDANKTPGTYHLSYIAQFIKLRGITNLLQGQIAGLPFTYQAIDPNQPNYWRNTQYWFNLETHQEIVDLAAKAAMESIEHPRYQTFINEVVTHE